jgi:flagellar hook-basal body complex protein FliE
MSLAVAAIGVTPPVMPTLPAAPLDPTVAAGAPGIGGSVAAGSTSGTGFADALSGAVDNLGALQGKADALGVQAATGTLQNPHDYLIAATEASLTTQMTVAVRNKALEAFNEIMRMPL